MDPLPYYFYYFYALYIFMQWNDSDFWNKVRLNDSVLWVSGQRSTRFSALTTVSLLHSNGKLWQTTREELESAQNEYLLTK